MKKFKLWNTLCGWVVFAIAAATYLLTMEPTASFWDCGEFISSAAKLDVGHPPGAPFFMLMGHFFSLFASDTAHIAMCVNALSALASAFTILFLFWTITALAKKLVEPNTLWRGIGLLGAGAVGALAYTFSDTFWFSAVEGEVYASSSLFTAVVFWLMLKWDEHADEEGSDRWLIAIAYLMGLSIGVHLLNLLTIPAIGLVYYFRRYSFSWKGLISAFLASCAVLLVILYGIIPGFPTVAGWFELMFVNTFECPVNTGLAVYLIFVVASLVWAILETYWDKNQVRTAISFTLAFALSGAAFLFEQWWTGLILCTVLISLLLSYRKYIPASVLNTVAVMITVIVIGYSSYAALVIRSNALPPMDQNSPRNVFALKYYLNREQYGDRPLLYGQYYNAPVKKRAASNEGFAVPETIEGAPQYVLAPHVDGKPDKYIVSGHKISYQYQKEFCTLFPRMYSSQDNHISGYKSWSGMPNANDATNAKEAREIAKEIKKRTKSIDLQNRYSGRGWAAEDVCPTFGDNLQFFFNYQVHFMYWRYFMWNFVGRQNDIQSHGDITKGQWISGISFIDNARLGDQSKLPKELRENKGHNVYYFLPLLLGIIGILWQVSRKKDGKEEGWKNFTLTFLLFFLTGLAIVIYLNQTPFQPRERDYAYAGSFYAFCIWIGLGALALVDWAAQGVRILTKKNDSEEEDPSTKIVLASVAGLVTVVCLGVPALMAQQNWDDHDRSDRYVCRDFGANYLKSCDAGGILFTFGDNDTFPLWYNQEVEGVGDSLRVCNLSYLSADWYISQMKRPYYYSEALPISWNETDYMADKNAVAYIKFKEKETYVDKYGNTQFKDNPLLDSTMSVERAFAYLLSDDEKTKNSDNENALPTNHIYVLSPEGEPIFFEARTGYGRSDMMIMEIIAGNKWERPIYFSSGTTNVGLNGYLEQTGLTYQLTPYRSRDNRPRVNSEKMYDNMMNKFQYGNVSKPGIYLDENTMRMCYIHRQAFVQLAMQLINERQNKKALEVLERCEKELPGYNIPYNDYTSFYMVSAYLSIGEPEKAMKIAEEIARYCGEYIDFAASLSERHFAQLDTKDLRETSNLLRYLLTECQRREQYDFVDKYVPKMETYYKLVSANDYVYNMAILHFDLGEENEAMSYTKQFAATCDEIFRSVASMSKAELGQNDFASADYRMELLAEIMGRALEYEKYDYAEDYARKMVAYYQKVHSKDVKYYLALMYLELGERYEAVQLAQDFAEMAAEPVFQIAQCRTQEERSKINNSDVARRVKLLDSLIKKFKDKDYGSGIYNYVAEYADVVRWYNQVIAE